MNLFLDFNRTADLFADELTAYIFNALTNHYEQYYLVKKYFKLDDLTWAYSQHGEDGIMIKNYFDDGEVNFAAITNNLDKKPFSIRYTFERELTEAEIKEIVNRAKDFPKIFVPHFLYINEFKGFEFINYRTA